jgi:hypothetical protein
MMTKDMAFAMYNLSPTTGSNDILGNQLMQKVLVSSFKYTISGNLIVGNSGGTFKEWIPKKYHWYSFVWKSYSI